MATHLTYGKWAEKAALDYLLAKGYDLLAANYRYQRAEVDLIMCHEKTLVLVEVKARTRTLSGLPEEAVSARKEALLLLAAQHYIETQNWPGDVRFDIIAISGLPDRFEVHHIEDAFH
jgi:putative endonuclease